MPALNLEGKANWEPVRQAYLQRIPAPSYRDLANEFGIPQSTVAKMGLEERWPQLRLDQQNAAMQLVGASDVIVQALTAERQAIDQAKQVAMGILCAINNVLESIVDESSDPKRARKTSDFLQTCSFTYANVTKGLKDIGVVGFPKELADAGKGANGKWDSKLLNQINVTIQGLTSDAKVKQVERSIPTASEPSVPTPPCDAVDISATDSASPASTPDGTQSKQD